MSGLPVIPTNVGEVNVRALFIWAPASVVIIWADDGELIVVRNDEIVRFTPAGGTTPKVFRALVTHVTRFGSMTGYGEHVMDHQPGASRKPAGGF